VLGLVRISKRVGARETVGKDFELTGRRVAVEGGKGHLVALLERRAVPGAVPGNERSALVLLGELGTIVEEHSVRRPVAGEGLDWILELVAAPYLRAIAPVLRHQHLLLALPVVVAVRPSKIVSIIDLEKFLGRQLSALLLGVEVGEELVELIASVLQCVQAVDRVIPRKRHRIPDARGIARVRRVLLARLVGLILPDAGVLLEERTRILTGRPLCPGLFHARIRGCADVYVQIAVSAEGERLYGVSSLLGKTAYDGLLVAGGHEFIGRFFVAPEGRVGPKVEVPIAQANARATGVAEVLSAVGRVVAGRVPERRDATTIFGVADSRVHVTVLGHREVARASKILSHDGRAKAFRERQAGVRRVPGVSRGAVVSRVAPDKYKTQQNAQHEGAFRSESAIFGGEERCHHRRIGVVRKVRDQREQSHANKKSDLCHNGKGRCFLQISL
jgi:hypothetical protein